jgi:hypothetical protein
MCDVTRDSVHICIAGILQHVHTRVHICRDRYYLAIHHDGDLCPTIFFSILSMKEYTKVILLDKVYKTQHYPWSRGDVAVNASVEETNDNDRNYFQSIMERDRGVTLFCPWNNAVWDHLQALVPLLRKSYSNVDITLGS